MIIQPGLIFLNCVSVGVPKKLSLRQGFICKYLLKEVSPEDSSKGVREVGQGRWGSWEGCQARPGPQRAEAPCRGALENRLCVRVVPT